MKTLLINGSYNKGGSTASALNRLIKNLPHNNYTCLQISELNIAPCRGCLDCRPAGVCQLPVDDSHRIGELWKEHDIVIIGSPVYWGNIPGALKILFDRNVTSLEHFNKHNVPIPLHKKKPVFLLVSSSAPWPINRFSSQAAGALKFLNTIFKASGFSVKRKIILSGNKRCAERQLSACSKKINLIKNPKKRVQVKTKRGPL